MSTRVVVDHSPYRLQDGRWVANFELEFYEGASITLQRCLEPRIDLTFDTREQAIDRNRQLAENWRREYASRIELWERKSSLRGSSAQTESNN